MEERKCEEMKCEDGEYADDSVLGLTHWTQPAEWRQKRPTTQVISLCRMAIRTALWLLLSIAISSARTTKMYPDKPAEGSSRDGNR